MDRLVLHLREAAIYGSPERLIIGQMRHAERYRGLPVTYRKAGARNDFATELERQDIEFRELIEHFTGDLTTVFRLARLIRSTRPVLLVSHEYKSNLYARLAAMLTGVPHLIHFHGVTSEDTKVRLYNRIDLAVMRRARGVITISPETKRRLADQGVDADHIQVVINAVLESAFEKVPFECPAFEQPGKLLVAAGRLSHEKGFDLLLDAFAALRSTGRSANLLIYGDGPELPRLSRRIEALGLSSCVRLAGFVRDVRPSFGAMEFLVVPSRSEGFPLVLLEAWAQGAPVVATPVGGLPNLIKDNVNGLLAAAPTESALADALARALDMADFKTRCGAEGLRLAREKYNFKRQVEELEAIYDRYALAAPPNA